MEVMKTQCLIIGAGILGLTIARQLLNSGKIKDLIVIDKYPNFGWGTSSRNSEVIHAGIYYNQNKLKETHCINGREILYKFLETNKIPHKKTGKYILAFNNNEQEMLQQIKSNADRLKVPVDFVTKGQIKSQNIKGISFQSALYSTETGIVDSHHLMQHLESEILSLGGLISYNSTFQGIDDEGLLISDPNNKFYMKSDFLVNCAGLGAAKVHAIIEPKSKWRIGPCPGRYFDLSTKYNSYFKELIYPVPTKGGLGIHITCDLSGQLRLGPDTYWDSINEDPENQILLNFNVDNELHEKFYLAGKKLIPGISPYDIKPSYIGIRPKLYNNTDIHTDFKLIHTELNGMQCISWLGIESPGLTAAFSLAESTAGFFNTTYLD